MWKGCLFTSAIVGEWPYAIVKHLRRRGGRRSLLQESAGHRPAKQLPWQALNLASTYTTKWECLENWAPPTCVISYNCFFNTKQDTLSKLSHPQLAMGSAAAAATSLARSRHTRFGAHTHTFCTPFDQASCQMQTGMLLSMASLHTGCFQPKCMAPCASTAVSSVGKPFACQPLG